MPGIPSQSSQQEPNSQASPRRRTGPSTATIPTSFAYGAAPSDIRSTISGGRPLGAPSSRQNNLGAPVINDHRNPLRNTSVQIANALLSASNSIETMPPSSSQNTSSSTLVGGGSRRVKGSFNSSSSFSRLAVPKESFSSDDVPSSINRARSPIAETAARARALSPHWVELVPASRGIHDILGSSSYPGPDTSSEREPSMSQSADEPSLGSREYSVLNHAVDVRYKDRVENLSNSLDAEAAAAATHSDTPNTISKRRKSTKKNADNAPFRPGEEEAQQEEVDDYYEHHADDKGKRKSKLKPIKGLSLPTMGAPSKARKRKSTGRKKVQGEDAGDSILDTESENESHSPSRSVQELPQDSHEPEAAPPQFEEGPEEGAVQREEAYPPDVAPPRGSYGVGLAVGFLWKLLKSFAVAVYSASRAIILHSTDILFTQPLLWLRNNASALLIASLLVSLIAYQILAPTSYSDDNTATSRRGLFSSIFGRSPNRARSRPAYTPPPITSPEDLEGYTSQFNAMSKDIAALFKDVADLSDSSDAHANNLRRDLERVKLMHDGSEQKHLHSLAEIRRAVNDLASKRGGLDEAATSYLNDRLAKLEVTMERMGDRVKGVETATESDPRLRDILKRVSQIESTMAAQAKAASSASGRVPSMKDGVPPVLVDYLEQRLIHWNKDRLGVADYAIFSAGGRIIPTLTSNTFEIPGRKPSWVARMLGFGGSGPASAAAHQGRPPATAIHPDNNVGHCWPFAGSKGHLGIFLSRQIFVDSVTIDHAPRELVPDVTPAPKLVRVWGVVDGQDNLDKLKLYRDELDVKRDVGTLTADEQDELDAVSPGPLPHNLELLQIASFSYNVNALNNVQTFPVPERIKNLGIDIGVVMFDIQSNHGNDEYTCLYRARVHGTPRSTGSDSGSAEGIAVPE